MTPSNLDMILLWVLRLSQMALLAYFLHRDFKGGLAFGFCSVLLAVWEVMDRVRPK